MCFFFNDTATTEIYTLSLHDALPILSAKQDLQIFALVGGANVFRVVFGDVAGSVAKGSNVFNAEGAVDLTGASLSNKIAYSAAAAVNSGVGLGAVGGQIGIITTNIAEGNNPDMPWFSSSSKNPGAMNIFYEYAKIPFLVGLGMGAVGGVAEAFSGANLLGEGKFADFMRPAYSSKSGWSYLSWPVTVGGARFLAGPVFGEDKLMSANNLRSAVDWAAFAGAARFLAGGVPEKLPGSNLLNRFQRFLTNREPAASSFGQRFKHAFYRNTALFLTGAGINIVKDIVVGYTIGYMPDPENKDFHYGMRFNDKDWGWRMLASGVRGAVWFKLADYGIGHTRGDLSNRLKDFSTLSKSQSYKIAEEAAAKEANSVYYNPISSIDRLALTGGQRLTASGYIGAYKWLGVGPGFSLFSGAYDSLFTWAETGGNWSAVNGTFLNIHNGGRLVRLFNRGSFSLNPEAFNVLKKSLIMSPNSGVSLSPFIELMQVRPLEPIEVQPRGAFTKGLSALYNVTRGKISQTPVLGSFVSMGKIALYVSLMNNILKVSSARIQYDSSGNIEYDKNGAIVRSPIATGMPAQEQFYAGWGLLFPFSPSGFVDRDYAEK